ncbi:ABC transporter, ATP-binding protein [delta proteobacterium NaphS2]|nr:ABC transporter, ATP-binding protein [delta proteobacterium NaphS2]
MSNTVINAENLGKRYSISHQGQDKYVALRDVITDKIKGAGQRIFNPSLKKLRSANNEEFWALKDLSLNVKQGEVVGIIGRNGAGKSTLLKILSRITEPTTGRIHIRGRIASLLEVGTGFHPELTGRENIFLNGSILGMSRSEINKKFNEIVEFAEIEKFLDTPVKRYSSGMYVRLAFAVAANLDSEILLIDEVLAVGDYSFRKKCLHRMGDITQKGRTILFVSHDLGAIRSLCHKSLWLDKGIIRKEGNTPSVVREYETTQILNNSQGTLSVRREYEDVRHRPFHIQHVEIKNEKGEYTNIFHFKDKMTLLVELSGTASTPEYSLEFRIYGQQGELAAMGASGAYHNKYFEKSVKAVRIDIGPLILTNGEYLLSLSIMTGAIRADTWESAISFYVTECQPFSKGLDLNDAVCVLQQSFSQIS